MRPVDIVTSTGRSSLRRPLMDRGADVQVIGPHDQGRRGAVRVIRTTGTGKLTQLRKLADTGVRTVPFTTDRSVAQGWVNAGHIVFCRHLLNSSRGKGISIIDGGIVPEAPLYTKMVDAAREWRCHYAFGETASVRKLLRNGNEPSMIRNRKNGYVFSGLQRNSVLEAITKVAMNALGYDVGAVDAIKGTDGNYYVLEVNRAPGIKSPSAHEFYTNAIIKEANRERE